MWIAKSDFFDRCASVARAHEHVYFGVRALRVPKRLIVRGEIHATQAELDVETRIPHERTMLSTAASAPMPLSQSRTERMLRVPGHCGASGLRFW